MALFRKKPVVIEAWQWDGSRTQRGVCCCETNSVPHVHTMHRNSLGGFQHVFLSEGDWIVPEPDGTHFYPIKSDVFAASYEQVPGAADRHEPARTAAEISVRRRNFLDGTSRADR